jgi:hypothetical protein
MGVPPVSQTSSTREIPAAIVLGNRVGFPGGSLWQRRGEGKRRRGLGQQQVCSKYYCVINIIILSHKHAQEREYK